MLTLLFLLLGFGVYTSLAQSGATEIRVNQVGYLTYAPKIAIVINSSAITTGLFHLQDQNGFTLFSGSLSSFVFDADTGDTVSTADFSNYTTDCDVCVIHVDGIVGTSYPFAIGGNVYQDAFTLAMRGFYVQRSGVPVELGFFEVGGMSFHEYSHDVCHNQTILYHESTGKNGTSKPYNSGGHGWHDAGDYGRYVVNGGITCGTLLWAWELFGDYACQSLSLGIPESNGDMPDYLAEVRWNLDWMLSMQDTDGGVFHKETSLNFDGFEMPEFDASQQYVIGLGFAPYKGTCATADLVAVMAIASRVYASYDANFSATALSAAEAAFNYTLTYPNAYFNSNPSGVNTGAYQDNDCLDDMLWAAMELYRATLNNSYLVFFENNYEAELNNLAQPPAWNNLAPMALWAYLMGNQTEQNQTIVEELLNYAVTYATSLSTLAETSAYHHSMASYDYYWGSNSVAMNKALFLILTAIYTSNDTYYNAALENIHYILGRNTFSVSWVTHVGSSYSLSIHHRPSIADQIQLPWPGLLSGGPNPNFQDAAVIESIPNTTAIARVWLDNYQSYSTNEIAINWNAPLVFSLAATLNPGISFPTSPPASAIPMTSDPPPSQFPGPGMGDAGANAAGAMNYSAPLVVGWALFGVAALGCAVLTLKLHKRKKADLAEVNDKYDFVKLRE